MAFVYATGNSYGGDPRAVVAKAFRYLRQSDLAGGIIDGLQAQAEDITIRVGTGLQNKYLHPKEGEAGGGTVEWDPEYALGVIDKAKARPQVPWVTNHTERHGFLWLQTRGVDKVGQVSPAIALIHELGHAHQFFSNRDEYRAEMKKGILKCLEDTNCAAIENTVCLELNARGAKEGIRWDYYHIA